MNHAPTGFNFPVYRGLIPTHHGGDSFRDTTQRVFTELCQDQQRHAAAQQIVQVYDHFVAGALQ